MAIEQLVPYNPPRDLMPLREIHDLLKRTEHVPTLRDIKNWIRKDGLDTVRHRGVPHAFWSDILLAHRDAVRAGDI